MPDPSSGPPRRRRAARVALSAAAADLATFAESIVPTRGDEHYEPADYATIARRIQVHALEIKIRAAILMRAAGATWADVAEAFAIRAPAGVDADPGDLAEAVFGDAYEQWAAGQSIHPPWMATGTLPRALAGDVDDVAAELDDWYARRTASVDRQPVTGSLPLV